MKQPEYDRKEEILNEGKRYRLHNNYLTFGGGILQTSLRTSEQKALGVDFHFHIKRQYFQAGIIMSGEQFLSNNNIQAHLGYGLRKETPKINLAAFAGLSYYTGVIGGLDTSGKSVAVYYAAPGLYISGQAITKLSYDIGIGLEIFGEVSKFQAIAGFKIILFFSGAYRGLKKNYNPHVRAENNK
ncbi:MAG: hypothetical protein HYX39_06745 [Bacteroidetes bacterium]|nr:hypothetical protein [Bacteroidota bacterium]